MEHYSDIAEEVARFFGYDKIPVKLMAGDATRGGFTLKQKAENLAGQLCRCMGYSEIMTYSFISPSAYEKVRMAPDDPRRKSVTILNPLGEDTSIMRTTALPSMLETLGRNFSYRNKSAKLYEMATVYSPEAGGVMAVESPVLSLGAYGDQEDFFTLKGAVEAVLGGLGVKELSFTAYSGDTAYHPGRCALVSAGEIPLGILGQVHPLAAQNFGMDCPVYAAQLDFNAVLAARSPESLYQPLPRYPSVARDIAVVCDAAIPVAVLEDCISRGASGLVKNVELFDIYTGAPIPEGKKSVAFSLLLRADDRTLTDKEADDDVKAILALLKSELGAVLR